MHANENCPTQNNDAGDDIAVDLYPFIREYKGGRVERFLNSPFVPASEDAAANRGVATRDVVIDRSTGISARLFLPSRSTTVTDEISRLPVIVYIHGGSFCTESAFSRTYNSYAKSLAARAEALVVSVEYRLAPEHPIPAAYDDAWAALRWAASSLSDPWLADYADPDRTFIAGDSAGGNIAYHMAVRASRFGVDIEGLVLVHPYFWGAERLASEAAWDGVAMFPPYLVDRLWPYVTAGRAGNDDPRIDPPEEEIASLACRRALVAVAGTDSLRDRGRRLASRMRDCCAWGGGDTVTVVESDGEDHVFHLHNPLRATSRRLMESIVEFVNQRTAAPLLLPAAFVPEPHELHLHAWEGKTSAGEEAESTRTRPILCLPARPYMDIFGYGTAMRVWPRPKSMTPSCLQIGQGKTSQTKYGVCLGGVRSSNKTSNAALSTAAPGCYVIKNFF